MQQVLVILKQRPIDIVHFKIVVSDRHTNVTNNLKYFYFLQCFSTITFQEAKLRSKNEEMDRKLEKEESINDEFKELSTEERYNKLMDLLNKSKFYSKFLQVSSF
jgi:hypothetical protein